MDISHHRMACKVTLTLLGWFMFCTYMAHEIYRSSEPAQQSFAIPTSLIRFVSTTSGPRIPQTNRLTSKNNERIKKQITSWNLFTCFYVAETFIHVCSKLCLSLQLVFGNQPLKGRKSRLSIMPVHRARDLLQQHEYNLNLCLSSMGQWCSLFKTDPWRKNTGVKF